MRDRDEQATGELVETLIRAQAGAESTAVLLADLLAHGWPAGVADRSEPAARGWLRMWGPVKIIAALPGCTCAAGRCPVCN